jgi:hypothetical protein
MSAGEVDLERLLADMGPVLDPATYRFLAMQDPPADLMADALMIFHEAEATTLVVTTARAEEAGFPAGPGYRRLSLTVHSSLDAFGLTAGISTALAGHSIGANIVAGYHHDHIFVPAERAEQALACLEALAASVGQD